MVDKNKSAASADIRKAIEPDQSLFKYSLLALVGALLGLIVAALLLYTLIINGSNRQLSDTVFRYQADLYAQAYSDVFAQMRQQLEFLSENSEVISQLQNIDAPALEQTSALIKSQVPHLRTLRILPFGSTRTNQEQSGLSFSAIDMVNKAEAGEQVSLEIHPEGGDRLVNLATAVKSPQTGATIGVILAGYSLEAISHAARNFNTQDGLLRLEQRFPGSEPTVLLSLGNESSSGNATLASPIANSYLNLMFQPSEQLSQENALPILHFWAPIAVAGLSLLLFVLLSYVKLRNAVRNDAIELVEYCRQLIGRDDPRMPKFQLSLFFSMAKTLAETEENVLQTSASSVKKQPQEAPAHLQSMAVEELVDSELDDDDILDLDLVGLNSDKKSTDPSITEEDAEASENEAALAGVAKEIFRAYDIRGIVDQTLDTDIAYRIGQAVGSEAAARGESSVAVGADGRLSSPELSAALIQGLRDSGTDVINLGTVPTPLVYYATYNTETKSGVMITGSHNPANYNGFKIVIAGETLSGEAIQGLYQRIIKRDFNKGHGDLEEIDIIDHYVQRIVGDVAVAKNLKVVVDCGNGVASVIAPKLLEAIGCEIIPLYCEIDGRFPNHHPDPGKPENLRDLIAAIKEHDADLGVAFDGDGDRLGVVTNQGNIIWPDKLLMLFAKDVVLRNPGADIIYDVKCSRLLADLISSNGGRPIMWKTGHSLIKSKMRETGALLAGEMSGHIFFKERWFGFDDGIYSACRLLEILSLEARDAEAVFGDFPDEPSTPEINIEVTEESKFALIDKLRKEANFADGEMITIDGVRVDFSNGWGLVRASNTTPMLVLRFAAESDQALAEIQERFKQQLLAVEPSLAIPF